MMLPFLAAAVATAMPLPPLEPAAQADLRCVAVFAMVAGQQSADLKDSETAGIAAAVLYYLGRIEARHADFALEPRMVALLEDSSFLTAMPVEAKRCGEEMQVKGQSLVTIGNALQAKAAKDAAKAK